MFKFLDYEFDEKTFVGKFHYEGTDGKHFCETITFAKTTETYSEDDRKVLDRAMQLAHLIIGTSYYKAHPEKTVSLHYQIDEFMAHFLNQTYQEGLSQFAYENDLTRDNLAHFEANTERIEVEPLEYTHKGLLVGQSGGKDSLLVATMLDNEKTEWTGVTISNTYSYPKIINHTGAKEIQLVHREVDLKALKETGGMNGHVPVTYINMSIMLIQAILNHQNVVYTSIGHEGEEPHAHIGDLIINHQWSKTKAAEKLFEEYIHRYISKDIAVYSPIREYSELKIAELFVDNCWEKYGHKFSSCNVANYKQGNDSSELKWCGECAKCANSYILFAPFLEPSELNSIFVDNKSLYEKPELFDDFKGLFGIGDYVKPFECVGETQELRKAYHLKKASYPDLPFEIPDSDFDYQITYK
ncbi:hypothetical protein IJ098_00025 [Candidatus Saccharibacteria bacterium]|nr:hypothetical protein [Candidatus Saccharibacteria bacterium]